MQLCLNALYQKGKVCTLPPQHSAEAMGLTSYTNMKKLVQDHLSPLWGNDPQRVLQAIINVYCTVLAWVHDYSPAARHV
jgi:hypothetical protein